MWLERNELSCRKVSTSRHTNCLHKSFAIAICWPGTWIIDTRSALLTQIEHLAWNAYVAFVYRYNSFCSFNVYLHKIQFQNRRQLNRQCLKRAEQNKMKHFELIFAEFIIECVFFLSSVLLKTKLSHTTSVKIKKKTNTQWAKLIMSRKICVFISFYVYHNDKIREKKKHRTILHINCVQDQHNCHVLSIWYRIWYVAMGPLLSGSQCSYCYFGYELFGQIQPGLFTNLLSCVFMCGSIVSKIDSISSHQHIGSITQRRKVRRFYQLATNMFNK